MIIYKDIVTGEELASDSYPMKVVDDIVYEFQAKTITIDDSGIQIASNADEEGADEGVNDEVQRVINIVHSHRLQQTSYDKKSFMPYIKNFMKKVKTHLEATNPSRVDAFMKNAQAFVSQKLLPKIGSDDITFYTTENMDPEGSMAYSFYPEGAVDPVFWIFIDGVKSEKF